MTHSLHVILRCDFKGADPSTGEPGACREWVAAKAHLSVPEAREWAAEKGWSHKPGKPYEHIGATDLCPAHTQHLEGSTPSRGI